MNQTWRNGRGKEMIVRGTLKRWEDSKASHEKALYQWVVLFAVNGVWGSGWGCGWGLELKIAYFRKDLRNCSGPTTWKTPKRKRFKKTAQRSLSDVIFSAKINEDRVDTKLWIICQKYRERRGAPISFCIRYVRPLNVCLLSFNKTRS